MTTFYRVQVGALEAQEFLKGPMRQMLFVVLLSNGMVVEPGGPHASPKGLRHGFGVTAVSKGIALNMVQKWLGHSQLTNTAIYANAVGEEEQNIASKMWT